MKRNELIPLLAGIFYNTYCFSVGGVAFNGDPLPKAEEFFADASKKKQSDAWLAVAERALEEFAPTGNCPTGDSRTVFEHDSIIDKALRRSLYLIVESIDTQDRFEHHSAERTLAKRRIQEGNMWLGMNLGATRAKAGAEGIDMNPSPYPHSKDPSTPVIDPPAVDQEDYLEAVVALEARLENLKNNQDVAWNEGRRADSDRFSIQARQVESALRKLKQ